MPRCCAIAAKQLKIYGSTLGSREEFRQLLSFIARTGIRPIIDSVFSLKDAARAQQRVETGQQFGKVALRIAE